jgi:predicted esterase
VDRRGVVDTKRIAVGGHSYGAFMAANLLVSLIISQDALLGATFAEQPTPFQTRSHSGTSVALIASVQPSFQ